jgi:hypothetical protein
MTDRHAVIVPPKDGREGAEKCTTYSHPRWVGWVSRAGASQSHP